MRFALWLFACDGVLRVLGPTYVAGSTVQEHADYTYMNARSVHVDLEVTLHQSPFASSFVSSIST